MTTAIDILDTIAKVGVGALISGISSLYILKKKQKGELDKLGNQRRVEHFEDISQKVGAVNHIFSKYSSLAIESTRYGDAWPAARREELDEVTNELVAAYAKLAEAESVLLLLGEKRMEKALKLYTTKIANFRKEVYVGRQDIEESQIIAIKKEISVLKEQFYDILSLRYDRAVND